MLPAHVRPYLLCAWSTTGGFWTHSNLPELDCRYLQEPELYAFSHGLSYTTFEYQKLALTASPGAPADPNAFTAQVEVHNTGTQVMLSQHCRFAHCKCTYSIVTTIILVLRTASSSYVGRHCIATSCIFVMTSALLYALEALCHVVAFKAAVTCPAIHSYAATILIVLSTAHIALAAIHYNIGAVT